MNDWLALFNDYRVPAQHITSLLLAGAIWRWGGAPERWLIGTFLLTMVVPVYLLSWTTPVRFDTRSFVTAYLLVDVLAAVIFVGIALNANRNYPLWIAGFQLVALGAHLVNLVTESVSPLAIAILIAGPAYCQLLVLIAGFVRHVRRERRFGPYRDWRQTVPVARGLQF